MVAGLACIAPVLAGPRFFPIIKILDKFCAPGGGCACCFWLFLSDHRCGPRWAFPCGHRPQLDHDLRQRASSTLRNCRCSSFRGNAIRVICPCYSFFFLRVAVPLLPLSQAIFLRAPTPKCDAPGASHRPRDRGAQRIAQDPGPVQQAVFPVHLARWRTNRCREGMIGKQRTAKAAANSVFLAAHLTGISLRTRFVCSLAEIHGGAGSPVLSANKGLGRITAVP